MKESLQEDVEASEEIKFMKDDLYLSSHSKNQDPNDSIFYYDSDSIGTVTFYH